MVTLHRKILGEGRPIVILHGLFGMLDNWVTLGKALAEHYKVILVDQRNHGNSPHTIDHDYSLMADDLLHMCNDEHLDRLILIGHSMGAKTAMRFALDHPEKVDALIVIDMGVKTYSGGHESIFRALRSLDLTAIASRKDADEKLGEAIQDPAIRQFLMKNLHRTSEGGYSWKFNFEALYNHYGKILSNIATEHPYPKGVAFIRGGHSGYISDADWEGIQRVFPKAQLFTIPNAGHWVHADQPAYLLELVNKVIAAS